MSDDQMKSHICDVLGEVKVMKGTRCEGCGRRVFVHD